MFSLALLFLCASPRVSVSFCPVILSGMQRDSYCICTAEVNQKWLELLFTKVVPVKSLDYPVCGGGKHVAVELFDVIFQTP